MELFRSEEMQLCQVGDWGGRPRPPIAALRAGGFGSAACRRSSPPLRCTLPPPDGSAPLLPCSPHTRPAAPSALQLMIPAEAAHDTIAALGEVRFGCAR